MLIGSGVLFFFVFLAQIFLISYYLPEKTLARMRYILKTYPPGRYPKLYPKPVEYYRLGHKAYQLVNRLTLLFGFVILGVATLLDGGRISDDGFIWEIWPALYGMIQLLPLMGLALLEHSQFKLMRRANARSVRKAGLHRRHWQDYIAPWQLSIVAGLFIAVLVLDAYANNWAMRWSQAFWVLGVNLLFVLFGARKLYGRQLNPLQTADDRRRQTAVELHSLLYVCIIINVFFLLSTLNTIFDLAFLEAVILSLYFQALALLTTGYMLRHLKLNQIDFDVYKRDPVSV